MTGIGAHVLSHVVRRGLDAVQQGDVTYSESTHQAKGDHAEINPFAIVSAAAVLFATVLMVLSLDYTIGSVIGTLTMIESDSTNDAVVSPPLRHGKESDATAKQSLLNDEPDVEHSAVKHNPITSSIRGAIKHLHSIGGFKARWRGLGQALLFSTSLAVVGQVLGQLFFGGEFIATELITILVGPILLCRLHMLWTHAMIAMPTSVPWYRRFVARKSSRAVLLPIFVATIAVHLSFIGPVMIGVSASTLWHRQGFTKTPFLDVLVIVLGWTVYVLCLFFVTIPASATLARVEACLLPEEHQTVVPFDRDAILGSIDLTVKGAPGKLFASAWKSFSFAARIRVMKLYVKLFFIETLLLLAGTLVSVGILYMTGQLWVLALLTYPVLNPQF